MKKIIVFLLSTSLVVTAMTGCTKTQKKVDNTSTTEMNEVATTQENDDVDTKETMSENALAYDIYWSKYDDLSDQNQSFFLGILGDEARAKDIYDKYFLKFNIIHEASHVIQRKEASVMKMAEKGDMFTLERKANEMAVAYWKQVDPSFVKELESIVNQFLDALENPVPKGQDMGVYFNENIGELAANPAAYGYYQFYFVKEAIKLDRSYYDIVKEHINPNLRDATKVVNESTYEAGDVEKILQDYVNFATLYGIEVTPIISIEEASPQIQHMNVSENPDLSKAIVAREIEIIGKVKLQPKKRSHGDELIASLENISKDGIIVIYSEGHKELALNEHNRLLGMKEFYFNKYKTDVSLELALLNRTDWDKGSEFSDGGPPYGIPHVDHNKHDYTIYVPATDDGALVGFSMQYADQVTDEILNNFSKAGYSYEEGVKLFPKLIGLHEVGHTFVDALGMKDLEFWFNEFMATYFTYAYLAETDESLAKLWVSNGDVAFLDGRVPKYTSLKDLNELGTDVGVEEYDWYQKEMAQLAKNVYESKGIEFIDDVIKMYNSPDYTSSNTIERLEGITPVFKSWEKELNAFNQ